MVNQKIKTYAIIFNSNFALKNYLTSKEYQCYQNNTLPKRQLCLVLHAVLNSE